jgi:hypothetical protein
MNNVRIAVVAGIAALYPFGQQGASITMKAGQKITLDVGVTPEEQGKLPISADLHAPAVGVETDAKYGERDGTIHVHVEDGAVTVRVYDGSEFKETLLVTGHGMNVSITESNHITLALYAAVPTPKE